MKWRPRTVDVPKPPSTTETIDRFMASHITCVRMAPDEPISAPTVVRSGWLSMKPSAHSAQPCTHQEKERQGIRRYRTQPRMSSRRERARTAGGDAGCARRREGGAHGVGVEHRDHDGHVGATDRVDHVQAQPGREHRAARREKSGQPRGVRVSGAGSWSAKGGPAMKKEATGCKAGCMAWQRRRADQRWPCRQAEQLSSRGQAAPQRRRRERART